MKLIGADETRQVVDITTKGRGLWPTVLAVTYRAARGKKDRTIPIREWSAWARTAQIDEYSRKPVRF